MARGAWDHTAWLCAAALNANPFRQQPASPALLNPYRRRAKSREKREQEEKDFFRSMETALTEIARAQKGI